MGVMLVNDKPLCPARGLPAASPQLASQPVQGDSIIMTKIRSVTSHLLDVDNLELELTHKPDSDVMIRKTAKTIIVGYLVQDSDCANPLEDCDGLGSIRSLNRRHHNHIDRDEAVAILESDKDAVALSYFEHGLCKWGVEGTMSAMADFNWDGVSLAGVWIPDDCVRESYNKQDEIGRAHV